jgi:putative Holliday junction resolvase
MAVDYGGVRTGVVFSDLTNTLAGEALTITERGLKPLAAKLIELAKARNADTVALGYPLNEDGSVGHRAEQTDKLAAKLKGAGFTVELIDERYTSLEAQEILRDNGYNAKSHKKGKVDAVAAALILETYLNR